MASTRKPSSYVLAFVGIFALLYLLYQFAEPLLPAYYAGLAHSVCWLLGWFDPAVTCKQNYLEYGGVQQLVVVEGCDGVTFVVLILAAVLPFPAPWRARLIGIAALVGIIMALNWTRLVVLAAVKFYSPAAFDVIHVYLFQPVMIAATLIAFLAWTVVASAGAGQHSSVTATR
jgi:exosortase/archaeosortase family protein